jgi:hypothetical protein
MRKRIVLLFAVGLLAASMLAPAASATGSGHGCPGLSTAEDASNGKNFNPGQASHACSPC